MGSVKRMLLLKIIISIFLTLSLIGFYCGVDTKRAMAEDAFYFDQQELEEFLDGLFSEKMEEYHIPGAVFSMVKDGEIFLTRGYGYGDLENNIPADPRGTLFRVGSVTKLVTATAVMQLYEKELLDLHEDVNRYLSSFQLEDNFPQPVTMANLLTHTGGFANSLKISVRTEEEVIPLGQFLEENMPPRIRPAGEVFSYSNHGLALAGYLVEEITGECYFAYTERNIFNPLKMENTFFPEANGDLASLARGYSFRNGSYEPIPFDYILLSPAGSMVSTAHDMARFMLAHLQHGYLDGQQILTEQSTKEMHSTQFSHHPGLPGFGYGIFEMPQGDYNFIGHAGGYPGFVSVMLLLPEQNTGFFCSYNVGDEQLMNTLLAEFMERYYPQEDHSLPGEVVACDLGALAGNYRWIRYDSNTIEKLLAIASELKVSIEDDTTILTQPTLALGAKPSRWIQVEPLLFKLEDRQEYIAFRMDEDGTVPYLFTGLMDSLERLSWYEGSILHLGLIAFCLVVFLSALIVWPLGFFIRRLRGALEQNTVSGARPLAMLLALFNTIFLVGLFLLITVNLNDLLYGVPLYFCVLLVLPVVTAVLSLVLVYFTVKVWRSYSWTLLGRIYYTLVTLAGLAFIPILYYWNLLGFNY